MINKKTQIARVDKIRKELLLNELPSHEVRTTEKGIIFNLEMRDKQVLLHYKRTQSGSTQDTQNGVNMFSIPQNSNEQDLISPSKITRVVISAKKLARNSPSQRQLHKETKELKSTKKEANREAAKKALNKIRAYAFKLRGKREEVKKPAEDSIISLLTQETEQSPNKLPELPFDLKQFLMVKEDTMQQAFNNISNFAQELFENETQGILFKST